ncbi:MAG: hypothetical protein IJ583_10930 [Firmicutes bacterium]|nr:hypothetical protein [Bacillota bacterium]
MHTCDEHNKLQKELRTAVTDFNITQSFNNFLNIIKKLLALANYISHLNKEERNNDNISDEFYLEARMVAQGEFECISIDTIIEHSIILCEFS